MGFRDWLKPRFQDFAMKMMDPLRPDTVGEATGEVLEIGFGTGRNLEHYASAEVRSLHGLDPLATQGVATVDERIARADFPVQRVALSADSTLPFDAGRFDCIVTTWTLCSIPDVQSALSEMHRVLKPGGRYLFIEHGRARAQSVERWQDRLDPLWTRLTDGCHINRPIDRLVERGGFELRSLVEFQGKGPALVSSFYRGVALRD
jgi:ubiquinone/menaquinone biosynthesis C-methylase UbiE